MATRVEITPTLILSAGGVGGFISNIIKHFIQKRTGAQDFPAVKFLYLDSTSRDYGNFPIKALDLDKEFKNVGFDPTELKALFEKPEAYKLSEDISLAEIITEWYRNFFKNNVSIDEIKEGCGGLPILCRVAFLRNHFTEVATTLEQLVRTLNNTDEINKELVNKFGGKYTVSHTGKGGVKLNVYLIISLSSGTGRGLYEQLNVLTKTVAARLGLNFNQVRTRFFVILPFQFKDKLLPNYGEINTYAAFKEINSFQEKGYRAENYVIELYRINGLNSIDSFLNTEKLSDQICLVSPVFENGNFVSEDFNEFAERFAKFIVDSIFDGFQNLQLSREANLENILSGYSKVRDIEAGKERGRHYSRMMYTSLYVPFEDMKDYISANLVKHLLEDLRLGSIPVETKRAVDRDVLKEDLKVEGRKVLTSLDAITNRLKRKSIEIPTEITDLDMINQIEQYVQDIIENDLKNLTKNISQLMNLEEVLSHHLEASFNTNSNLIQRIKIYIADHGGLQGFINVLQDILDDLINEELQYAKALTRKEVIEKLEKEENYREILNNLLGKIENTINLLQGDLNSIVSLKGQTGGGIKKIVKFIFKAIDDETKEKAEQIVASIKNSLNQFIDDLEKILDEARKYTIYHFIKLLMTNLQQKVDIIKGLENELENIMDNLVIPKEEGSKRIMLTSRSDGNALYTFYMNFKKNKGDNLLKSYERRLENMHIFNNLASYVLNLEGFKGELRYIVEGFKQEIRDIISKDFPEGGLQFLDVMLEPVNEKLLKDEENRFYFEPRESVKYWVRNEGFWGILDLSRAGEAASIFQQRDTFVITTVVPKKYKNVLNVIREGFGNKNFEIIENPEADSNTVKILGVHYGLPLFVFQQLYPMKSKYIKEKKELRPKYHISEWLAYEEEPIGVSYGGGFEDLKYILLLAYTLGAIKGDLKNPSDIICRFKFITDSSIEFKYVPLEVKSTYKRPIRTSDEISSLSESFKYSILEQLRQSIVQRYIYLVDKYSNDPEAEEALKAVLSRVSIKVRDKSVIPFKDSLRALLKQQLDKFMRVNYKLELVAKINSWLTQTENEQPNYDMIDMEIEQIEDFDDAKKVFITFPPEDYECG